MGSLRRSHTSENRGGKGHGVAFCPSLVARLPAPQSRGVSLPAALVLTRLCSFPPSPLAPLCLTLPRPWWDLQPLLVQGECRLWADLPRLTLPGTALCSQEPPETALPVTQCVTLGREYQLLFVHFFWFVYFCFLLGCKSLSRSREVSCRLWSCCFCPLKAFPSTPKL